ncbi:hypothetical protein AAFF_G00421200 [Aldrovandia affinis]|uniref:NACHT domain-containing protein n=1 Tax=Aldrovandia affinis TaxID=143900 RepID=A0AAD7WIW8_9TELE|nr:hypothetical protein AAFF_G00421200 [Aldrovandia affinis]
MEEVEAETDVPAETDVLAVVAEVRSELVEVLYSNPDERLQHLYHLAGPEALERIQSVADRNERISNLVDHFSAEPSACTLFVQMACMECELPLHLETRLLSVAGDPRANHDEETPGHPDPELINHQLDEEVLQRPAKRQRIDMESYITAVKNTLLQKFEQVTQGVARAVQLDKARVSLQHRTPSKQRDRAERAPLPQEGEEGGVEDVVTVESLLSSLSQSRLTVLLGPAGSGKTVLMHCAGQRWAHGELPNFHLLFLLEFRQLNLVTRELSLRELLFLFFPLPDDHNHAHGHAYTEEEEGGEAVLAFMLENPEKVCVIFDGYDEFRSKFTPWKPDTIWDPRHPLSVLELFSGLCSGRILLGCSVLVTCRPRNTVDLPDSDVMGVLLGFDRQQVKEYAEEYFRGTGHGEGPIHYLLANRHILTMCYVPSLCHLCCVCLDHLFSHGPHPPLQLPDTVTQVYLQILTTFLSRVPEGGAAGRALGEGRAPPPLQRYRAVLRRLCQLAMQGLDDSSIVFCAQDVPSDLLDFATKAGLLSQFELTREDGSRGMGCAFIHLAMQEFLGALHLMTSEGVDEPQLRRKLNLKTRWATRTDPKTVFADTLHLYVCGLTAPACMPHLAQLVGGGREQVQKRQGVVLKILSSFASSTHLTGPKLVELCRCAHETQDVPLAGVVGARPSFELRNIHLTPVDMDALDFVISAAGRRIGLDIAGCSMAMECLQALPSCIDYLIFRSRKYGDAFAGVLSGILPRLPTLRRFELVCGSLKEAGAAKLASALESCPEIAELNLSDNNLRDGGLRKVLEVLPRLTSLCSVSLGKNGCSLKGVLTLLEKMAVCPSIRAVQIDCQKRMSKIEVSFFKRSESLSAQEGGTPITGRTVSLWNCYLTVENMNTLCQILARCPDLSVIDLSGGRWADNGLQVLVDSLRTLTVSKEIVLNRSTVSLDGLLVLTRSLTVSPCMYAVDARLQESMQVSVLFSPEAQRHTPGMSTAKRIPKRLRLVACGLRPANLSRLCDTLRDCPTLELLDVSGNALGNKGLKQLLDFLPWLSAIREIDVSRNAVTMEGVLLLAGTLCTCRSLHEVEVSLGDKKTLVMKFHSIGRRQSEESQEVTSPVENGLHLNKKFSLTHSDVQPSSIDKLCGKLAQCPGMLELNLSHSSLGDVSIKRLLKHLPGLTALQLLDVSHVQMSTEGALLLVRSLIDCQRVKAVELRPQGEAFIKFHQIKAEQVTCKLTQYQLTCGNVEKLSEILQQCSRISDLDLSGNLLRDEGVQCFMEFLPELQISSSVKLHDNRLTLTGVLCLVNSITVCKRVVAVEVSLGMEEKYLIRFIQDEDNGKALSLRECYLRTVHLQKLSDILQNCPRLVRLELCCNTLQNEGLQILQRSLARLPSLQILGIRKNGLRAQVIEDLLKELGCPTNQLEIRVEEPWIREEAAVQLVSRCLELNSNIRKIRANKSTVSITLDKDASRDYSMMATSTLSLVKSIGLVDCALRGQHLHFLHFIKQKCPLLQELDLSHNSISREGAEFLSSTLPALANLRRLRLESKQTSEVGVKILTQGLSQCHSLESLSLAHHVINDEGATALARTLPKLQHLRAIDLSCCSILTAAGSHDLVRGLGQCASLEDISLDSVKLDAEGIMYLATGLRSMASLRRLILNKITMTTGSSEQGGGAIMDLLQSLEGFQQMEEIELDEVRMGDCGVQELVRHLRSWQRLRRISLSENCMSDVGGEMLVEALGHCTALEEIILSSNSLVASATKLGLVLPMLTRLRVLHLVKIGTPELTGLAASLGHCVCVEEVSLAWNDCEDAVAVKLAQVLPQCQKLKSLDLECNKISSVGAEKLAKSLRSCPSVEVVRLWKNRVTNEVAERLQAEEPRLNFSST